MGQKFTIYQYFILTTIYTYAVNKSLQDTWLLYLAAKTTPFRFILKWNHINISIQIKYNFKLCMCNYRLYQYI